MQVTIALLHEKEINMNQLGLLVALFLLLVDFTDGLVARLTKGRSLAGLKTRRGTSRVWAGNAAPVDAASVDTEDTGDGKKALQFAPEKGPVKYEESGTQYIMCSQCKSSYVYDEKVFESSKGRKVCCGVCGKEWFQSGARVLTTDDSNYLSGMTETKMSEIRRAVEMRNWPRFPKTNKIGVFVGNLPYNYDEQEIGDIFAEYGITNISLVRDPTGLSKGFAFVEVAYQEDADRMIEEMHHFYTDGERKLTVRLATQNANRGGGGGGGGNRGGGDRKVWKKRN